VPEEVFFDILKARLAQQDVKTRGMILSFEAYGWRVILGHRLVAGRLPPHSCAG